MPTQYTYIHKLLTPEKNLLNVLWNVLGIFSLALAETLDIQNLRQHVRILKRIYAPLLLGSFCASCVAGTSASFESSVCTSCSPGTFSGDQAAICTNCISGKFQPLSGASQCLSVGSLYFRVEGLGCRALRNVSLLVPSISGLRVWGVGRFAMSRCWFPPTCITTVHASPEASDGTSLMLRSFFAVSAEIDFSRGGRYK